MAKPVLVLYVSALLGWSAGSLNAQDSYPALVGVISFEELLARKLTRTVEWTNPNGVHEKMDITEMAIPIDGKMKDLTTIFLHFNYGRDAPWLNPRMIIFHAMGDGDLKTSLEISSFLNDEIPDSWGLLYKAGKLPNGAHFIIEKDGGIICLTPPVSRDESRISYERENHKWFVRRHQDGNPLAIGIENVTDRDDLTGLTNEQIESNARLARWLIWLEGHAIAFAMSHHQFNDDRNYDVFLSSFNLIHRRKEYRTRGRKDIGDDNLRRIIHKVNSPGWDVRSFFELK